MADGSPERALLFSIVLRAVADEKHIRNELEALPAYRKKRRKNLESELADITEFFSSPWFDFCCGSIHTANAIRCGKDSVSADLISQVLEDIINI